MTFEDRFALIYRDLTNIDVEQLGSLYHDHIVFIDPVTKHTGLSAVKQYFAHLLDATSSCQFDIHLMTQLTPAQSHSDQITEQYVVEWTMNMSLKRKPETISVDGVSLLHLQDNKIIYHRDYYDLGEMVYEQVPILRNVINYIKKKLSS